MKTGMREHTIDRDRNARGFDGGGAGGSARSGKASKGGIAKKGTGK